MSRPGVDGGLDVGHAVGEGEGDLLRGGGAGLAHVVAGDGDGVPLGDFGGGPGEHVGDDAHGVGHRIDVGAAGDVLLEDVVLHGAGELLDVGAAAPGGGDVEREQDAGGGVDGHGGGDGVELDAGEEALHVFDGVDGDADLADFAEGHGVVGVVADLGGEIEGDREAGGAVGEEEFVAAVGLFCIAHAGVLAHGPEAAAVHGGLDAAGVGILAGVAEVAVGIEVWRPGLLLSRCASLAFAPLAVALRSPAARPLCRSSCHPSAAACGFHEGADAEVDEDEGAMAERRKCACSGPWRALARVRQAFWPKKTAKRAKKRPVISSQRVPETWASGPRRLCRSGVCRHRRGGRARRNFSWGGRGRRRDGRGGGVGLRAAVVRMAAVLAWAARSFAMREATRTPMPSLRPKRFGSMGEVYLVAVRQSASWQAVGFQGRTICMD